MTTSALFAIHRWWCRGGGSFSSAKIEVEGWLDRRKGWGGVFV
ncbi:hypothetical protein Hanom_Chr01g00002001 [Helianthus anomalus]